MSRARGMLPMRRERQPKLACPYCGHWFSKVIGHGEPTHTGGFKRYRRCESCKQRYRGIEKAEPIAQKREAS
jgi:transcriptional regulator NrdR family protein